MIEALVPSSIPAIIGFLAVGVILLTVGAESLVGASETIGIRVGLSPLVVGLTLVAFSTSAPELVGSLAAAFVGSNDLAMGNVVGSNIANILLVLGLAATIRPLNVHRHVRIIDTPLMVCITLVLVAFLLLAQDVSHLEGGVLFLGIVLYTVWRLLEKEPEIDRIIAEEATERQLKVSNYLLAPILLLSIVALSGGAFLFVRGGQGLAELLGVPERVIGLTVMALGTSLPEIATVLVAVRKGMTDLVVGNVVGSNIFNILSVVGLTGLVFGLDDLTVEPIDVVLLIVSAAALMSIMQWRKSISRMTGVVFVIAYVAYVVWLYYT